MSDPQTSAAVGPSPRTRLRRARTPLVIAALALLVSLALAALSAQPRTGRLDPRATDPAGSRAVAQVLEAQGVKVVLVRAADAAAAELARGSATLLVADDTLLGDTALSEDALAPLAGAAADVVLVAPSQATLEELVPEVRRSGADSGPADAPETPPAPILTLRLRAEPPWPGRATRSRPAPGSRSRSPPATRVPGPPLW